MFKNEKGLTLIELLITIAVIAVVAAISVPVVSNVIAASNTNSLAAMQEQVDQFVAEAAESGSVTLNGSTLEARIDQNGDGVDEYLVKTFPVDSKYTVSGTGDGPYTVALGSGSTAPVASGNTYTVGTGFTTNYIIYGKAGGSAIGYHSFGENANGSAAMLADVTPTTNGELWNVTVKNASGSIMLNYNAVNNNGNLGPDWGNYSALSDAYNLLPNFSYGVETIIINPASKTVTFVVVIN